MECVRNPIVGLANPSIPKENGSWLTRGPEMWADLHLWALDSTMDNGSGWLDTFSRKIPCGECRRHWMQLLKEFPPDFNSSATLFAWTVHAHNAVNKRLGKAEVALEVALTRWMNEPRRQLVPQATGGAINSYSSAQARPRNNALTVLSAEIDCAHASPAARRGYVACGLGLYGGRPHIAICKQCNQRRPTGSAVGIPHKDGMALGVADRSRRSQTPPQNSGGQPVTAKPHPNAQRLLLNSFLSPGDIVMLTATVRDLHRAYPGRFQVAVQTSASDLWQHNPGISTEDRSTGEWRTIKMHYPSINQSNQRPGHFIEGYTHYLAEQLNLKIPVTEFRGDIHLSAEEKQWANQVEQQFGYRGRYWIMMAGGKYDFTTKWWAPASYQKVVDHFAGRVQFVQCGQKDHWHPELKGVFNLIGKTSTREFIRLMYHAEGVICPVTFAMHLAAAVPTKTNRLRPCVVIAGGREPPHWEAYPGHQFLHTVGSLPCCERGGCWKSRCQQVLDGDEKDRVNLCERPVQVDSNLRIPQCMAMIQPADVIRAVERALSFSQ